MKKPQTGGGGGGGVGGKICRVKKDVWECDGSTSASKTEVTYDHFAKKNHLRDKTLPEPLLYFGHFNLSKNIKQTAVINITRQRASCCKNFHCLTFRMLQHASSGVTVT